MKTTTQRKLRVLALLTMTLFTLSACQPSTHSPSDTTVTQNTDSVTSKTTETTVSHESTTTTPPTTSVIHSDTETTSSVSMEPVTDTSITTTTPQNTTKETSASKSTTSSVTGTPSPAVIVTPVASGEKQADNEKATIDYSNTSKGYVMVKYKGSNHKVKVQVIGPNNVTQNYDIKAGDYITLGLTGGNGSYKIVVAENITGTKYSPVQTVEFNASFESEFSPFLVTNQQVNYTANNPAVKFASQITTTDMTDLQKLDKIYTWIVDNVEYDYDILDSLPKGYLADVNKVIDRKKGICLDYAATMAIMLRSQGIPTKLLVGYAGETYHAWISVYIKGKGWVYNIISFDGYQWKRMDPTFASTANSSDVVMKFIANDKNYNIKYIY